MSACRHIKVKQQRYSLIPPVFACVKEAKELRENGLHQRSTKELGVRGGWRATYEQRPVVPQVRVLCGCMSMERRCGRKNADVCESEGVRGDCGRVGKERGVAGAEGTSPDVHSF